MCAIPFTTPAIQQRLEHPEIAPVRREQEFADGGPQLRNTISGLQAKPIEKEFARQRVAVSVQPDGRESEQPVSFPDAVSRQSALARSTTPTMNPARSYSPGA